MSLRCSWRSIGDDVRGSRAATAAGLQRSVERNRTVQTERRRQPLLLNGIEGVGGEEEEVVMASKVRREAGDEAAGRGGSSTSVT